MVATLSNRKYLEIIKNEETIFYSVDTLFIS